MSLLWKWGKVCTLPLGERYRPLHQAPSASFTGQYQPLPLVLGFIAPCVGHCGVSSVGGRPLTSSHWLAASTWAWTLAKSTPRKVTMTSCPWIRPLSVMLTGASGNGAVGAAGCAGGGWLAPPGWRRARPAWLWSAPALAGQSQR